MKCKITDIHEEDAYYDLRDKLIGKTVQVQEDELVQTEFEGFVTANAYLYEPVEMTWGDLSLVPFAYVKLEKI